MMFELKWTVLLLILGLLTSSTPMHLQDHKLSTLDSMSSESSDSAESAETDHQVPSAGPQLIGGSHVSESDIVVKAPADFGRPNKNGRSAVTVSLRDENTNVSVDVLTFLFAEDGGSSTAGESSGLSDEGMQADGPPKTQLDVTDQLTMDADRLEKSERVKSEKDELGPDIQADEAFIADKTGEDIKERERKVRSIPFYTTDHGFGLSSESNSSLEDTDASYLPDSGSDNHHTEDPQSDSIELPTLFTTALRSLLGELIGVRSFPAPLNLWSLTSGEDTTSREAKAEGADPRSDSIDSRKVPSHSGPTLDSQTVPSLNSSSEEEAGDEDKSFVTDATPSHTLSLVPSPELMAVKKAPLKSFSSGPVYVNDGWPAVDYSNSLKDFSHHYGEYEEWDRTDNSIKSYHTGTPTDTNHATDTPDLEEGPTEEDSPAYSWEATENENIPTEAPKSEDNSQEEELEITSGFPASREDGTSSETSKETAFQLPNAPDASPTDAALSNSQESTETFGSETGATTMSSSSEEGVEMDSADEESLGSNSTDTQNQTNTPNWPGKQVVSGAQLVMQVNPNNQAAAEGKPVDLTPGSSSEEELDPVFSTYATGGISSPAPASSEEQVSPGNMGCRSQTLSTSNEENSNAGLNPAVSGNSSSEDKQDEESFSNESTTDSPVELTPESTLSLESLEVTTERPAVTSEPASERDFLVSDEDISPASPSSGPQISGGLADGEGPTANDANESEESQELQDFTSSTVLPVPRNPSQTPHPEQSSEEDNIQDRRSDQVMTTSLQSNSRPTATLQAAAANPWTAFLQALKYGATSRRVQHADHKGQRSWSSYGNRRHHSNRGKKASSSEESK